MTTRQYIKTIHALLLGTFSIASHAGAMCSSCAIPYTWNGAYGGLQAGYAWNKLNWNFSNPSIFNTDGIVVYTDRIDLEANGFAGGGTLGYNFQQDAWFLGLEGEIIGMSAEHSEMSPFFPLTDVFSTSSKWLTTIKARVGHAHDDWMVWLGGGWAGGHFDLTLATPAVVASTDKWVNGWVGGIGAEYRINASLSFGVSYEYIRLLSDDLVLKCLECANYGFPAPELKAHVNKQIVAARLNYYLDEGYY